jgi:magnesium-transporting ATPase (P-type)
MTTISTQPTPKGLTAPEAAARLRLDGPNRLPAKPGFPVWRQLGAQLVHFFAIMLWVAGGLAILAGMPQLGVAIFVVIVFNAIFAFVQEYRAERTAEKLRDLLPQRVTVLRDGQPVVLDAADVVMGDAVLLSSGDRISADLALIEAHALSIDTSTLSGESMPTTPEAGDSVFAGTFVVEGEGLGIVTATGKATRLGSIAQMTRTGRRPPTPLAQELDRVVFGHLQPPVPGQRAPQ